MQSCLNATSWKLLSVHGTRVVGIKWKSYVLVLEEMGKTMVRRSGGKEHKSPKENISGFRRNISRAHKQVAWEAKYFKLGLPLEVQGILEEIEANISKKFDEERLKG